LASKGSNLFTFYFKDQRTNFPVEYINVNETDIWIASKGEIIVYDKYKLTIKERFNTARGLPEDEISCFHFMEDSSLYVGTKLKGVYRFDDESGMFLSLHL